MPETGTPVLVDLRGGRPRVVGLVLESWYEWDVENQTGDEYAKVLTREGIEPRAWVGGSFVVEQVN